MSKSSRSSLRVCCLHLFNSSESRLQNVKFSVFIKIAMNDYDTGVPIMASGKWKCLIHNWNPLYQSLLENRSKKSTLVLIESLIRFCRSQNCCQGDTADFADVGLRPFSVEMSMIRWICFSGFLLIGIASDFALNGDYSCSVRAGSFLINFSRKEDDDMV